MNFTLVLLCLCYLTYFVLQIHGTVSSTACYGVNGLPCSSHKLSCISPLVIQIMKTTYGYRSNCYDLSGKSQCLDDSCCREEANDCFVLFSDHDSLKVHKECNGHQICTFRGRRRLDVSCRGQGISAYSKIQYDCIANDSLPTFYTDTPDVPQPPDIRKPYDPIIVGIIGAITVLVIIILVTICILCQIRQSQSKSQEDNNIVLSIRESCPPHYTTIDDACVLNRNYAREYEDVELNDQYSTSALVDNFDNNENTSRMIATVTNFNHNRSDNNDLVDKNYDCIADVQYPVGEIDDYNHISYHDKQEMAFDDNYNHISARWK